MQPVYTSSEILIFIANANEKELIILSELLDEEKHLYPVQELELIWKFFKYKCYALAALKNILN